MLSESSSGLSAGSGFEFKKETFGNKGKERDGGIEEMSNLFGKKYTYSFDYKKIREAFKEEAQKTGFFLLNWLRSLYNFNIGDEW